MALGGLSALGLSLGTPAALMPADLAVAGDGLVTVDTHTGREWLDLTQSVSVSYGDLVGAGNDCTPTCSTGSFAGWTLASEVDVVELLQNTGLPGLGSQLIGSTSDPLYVDSLALIELVGVTEEVNDFSNRAFGCGLLDPSTAATIRVGVVLTGAGSAAGADRESRASASARTTFGAWLFRTATTTVANPTALPLAATGVLLLSWRRRRGARPVPGSGA